MLLSHCRPLRMAARISHIYSSMVLPEQARKHGSIAQSENYTGQELRRWAIASTSSNYDLRTITHVDILVFSFWLLALFSFVSINVFSKHLQIASSMSMSCKAIITLSSHRGELAATTSRFCSPHNIAVC